NVTDPTDFSALLRPVHASAISSGADDLVGDAGAGWNATIGSEAIAVDLPVQASAISSIAVDVPVQASAISSNTDNLVGDPGAGWNAATEAIAVDVLGVNPDQLWSCYALCPSC